MDEKMSSSCSKQKQLVQMFVVAKRPESVVETSQQVAFCFTTSKALVRSDTLVTNSVLAPSSKTRSSP